MGNLKRKNKYYGEFEQIRPHFQKVAINNTYHYMKKLVDLKVFVFLFALFISNYALSYTFDKAIMNLDSHPLVQSIEKQSLSLKPKRTARRILG